jgi:hypothetical protein
MMKSLASVEVLAETRERLRRLEPKDQLLWGRMTATEMVRHLGCAYEVALGDRIVGPMKGMPPVVLKWLALKSGLPWKKNLETTPELKVAISEDCGTAFDELVEKAIQGMEAVASGRHWQTSHPMFGSMTAADWMRWGYLHADHHLRQFGR